MPRPAPTLETLTARFWSRVQKSDGCWLWDGPIDRKGYGTMCWNRRPVRAPRIAWALTYGQPPPNQLVCHQCDTPGCVRPSHLFLGTYADNNRDRARKGRSARGDQHWARTRPANLLRGEAHSQSKLTEADVRAIRAHHAARTRSYNALAREYGVSDVMIHRIVKRLNWRHV